MHFRLWMIVICFIGTFSTVMAAETRHEGIGFSIPLITKDPEYLHAYRASVWLQPASLIFKHSRIYFDASLGHWWVTNDTHHHSLNIYALSPIFRYYFRPYHSFAPFVEVGIGPSYMTRSRLDHQNLGMHFAFQDQLGVGANLGSRRQFSFILSALHYSNASLCSKNAGITVPIMLNLEYGFA
ncbi:MAG: acyloxyacyl hydrolase [Gammaproteobacteria bacterium]